MKTAMQEAIDFLRTCNLLSAAIILEDRFLEKEKQQIVDAWEDGKLNERRSFAIKHLSAENYFTQTFTP